MAIPLIAAALYGMAGWQNNNNRKRKESREDATDARQAKLDERGEVEFNQRQDKIKSDLAYEDALKVSMSPGQQTAVMQGIGDNGSNFNTKDAGAAAMMGDMAAAKGETVGLNEATRVSAGRTGATMQGTVAGNQVFAKPADAQAFAQTQSMTEYAKLQARKEVAEQYGKMDLSDDIRAKMGKLESEGVFKAFALAQSGDMEGAAKAYESTGNARMPKGGKFVSTEVEDPATKTKRQVISVVGADGAPLVPDLDKALRSYLTPQEQYTMNSGDRKFTLDERKTKVAEDAEATRALAQADQARKTDAMILKLAGGGGNGSASRSNTPSASSAPSFDALGSFDAKKAQAVAFEQASKIASESTGTPMTPEAQGQLAQKIYRNMEDAFATENAARERARVFRSAAAAAKTPEDLQALRSRASQSGYTEQEMMQLDPRFAPPKAQGEAKPTPVTPARPAKAPAYAPPADSPAGKAAANREASKAVSMEKIMQTKKAVTDAAASAIQSGDASAAQAAQDMDGFSALPAETKAQIRKIVFGR